MNLVQIKKILNQHKTELFHLGVLTLAIFGSIVHNTAKKSSDIDILIEFDSKRGLFAFIDLKNYLESLLKHPVDLVTKNALHPALKERILKEARRVF